MNNRILHVSCGGLGYGGVSSVIFSIVQTLHEQFEFDCIVFKKRCDREEIFKKYGNLYKINAYNDDGKRHLFELIFRPLRLYAGIYNICKRNKYQAIHCHNSNEEGICLLAAMHAGVKVRIAHSHTSPSTCKKSSLRKLVEYINQKLMIYAATEKIGCSEEACRSFFGKTDYRVVVNSIDLDRFRINDRINHSKLTFVHVGRYTYSKNQDMIIRVFQRINQHLPDSQLLLVGYGEDEEKLKSTIHKLNMESVVKLVPGDRVQVSKIYAVSDYMIFPSLYEGFGIVLIEAQAMGIPCFVSEKIQKEADVGLLTYINLNAGIEAWSNTILDYVKAKHEIDMRNLTNRLYLYSNESIGKLYASIYEGRAK